MLACGVSLAFLFTGPPGQRSLSFGSSRDGHHLGPDPESYHEQGQDRPGAQRGVASCLLSSCREGASSVLLEREATVLGSMPRELITRLVRAHQDELTSCFEQGLTRQPGLSGTVSIRFVITSSGAVSTAMVVGSTLDEHSVEECLAQAFLRIRFPSASGFVMVTYPVLLQPED